MTKEEYEKIIEGIENLKDTHYPPFPGQDYYNGGLANAQTVVRDVYLTS